MIILNFLIKSKYVITHSFRVGQKHFVYKEFYLNRAVDT